MLTRLQHKLLVILNNHINKCGIAPSFEELQIEMQFKSKSSIHRLLDALVERGFVRRIKHRARAIEVIRMPGERGWTAEFCGIRVIENPAVPDGEVWCKDAIKAKMYMGGGFIR